MEKLLLLDKDGTLIQPASGAKFVQQPWDQEPLPGVQAAVTHYVQQGYKPVIVSNQGGVEAGYKTLNATIAEMQFCLELFPAIEEAYFCPDFEGIECWRCWGDCSEQHRILYKNEVILQSYGVDGLSADGYKKALADPDSSFRKPGAGMLRLAIEHHGADEILYIGDRPEDEAAATAAKVEFVWADQWRAGR